MDEVKLTKSDIIGITETYMYYRLLDDECKRRIPEKFVRFLEEYSDLTLDVKIHPEIPLELQEISQEGWNLIAQISKFLK